MSRWPALGFVLLFVLLGVGAGASAQTPEVAALAGYGFGGSLAGTAAGQSIPIDAGVAFGGAFSLPFARTLRVEGLVTWQESRLSDRSTGNDIAVAIERYLAALQEETSNGGNLRFFGSLLIGATRFVPAGYDSDTRFTAGLGLGVKARLARHVGLRFEARGYYLPVSTSGATVCANGGCIFGFSGSGMFQGDLGGGIFIGF